MKHNELRTGGRSCTGSWGSKRTRPPSHSPIWHQPWCFAFSRFRGFAVSRFRDEGCGPGACFPNPACPARTAGGYTARMLPFRQVCPCRAGRRSGQANVVDGPFTTFWSRRFISRQSRACRGLGPPSPHPVCLEFLGPGVSRFRGEGVVPGLVFPHPACPARDGRRVCGPDAPLSPGMPVPGGPAPRAGERSGWAVYYLLWW
jgi:hypothetical protein